MKTNGDVMRADRLKQVMQEIDSSFDEGNLGMAKFSKFCLEAAQRGLLKVTKLDNGQLEVAPTEPASAPPRKPPAAPRVASGTDDGAARPERGEGRGRRGRRGRGGRGRGRPGEVAVAGAPDIVAPIAVVLNTAEAAMPHTNEDGIGRNGERLARDEAFALVRRAVSELTRGDLPVPSEAVRRRAHEILRRDSESLSERNFSRILRDAHDASVVDVRKRGDAYEVAPAASAPPVADQIGKVEAAHAAKAAAEGGPAATRSITGRRTGRGKAIAPPANLLSVGVVELDADEPAVGDKKAPRRRAPRKRAAPKPKP
jgi:hypothetical protein